VLGWLGGALGAAAAVAWWWRHGRSWWWRIVGTRRHGRTDPVRREAGRWLARLRARPEAGWSAEAEAVHAALLRLRYGPRDTWPEPQAMFRRARRTLRAERRTVSWR
jgi:protein-glutamine gamma-glutamyltransferase